MIGRPTLRDERGTTLMELTVGMAIMSIFMAMCTAAIVSMFSSTNQTQAVVHSSAQLNAVFDRLDTQVRYADLIDQPVTLLTAPYWSVAFQTDGATSTTCRQLAVRPLDPSTQVDLVENTWTLTLGSNGWLSSPGPKTQSLIATNVTVVADPPFTVSTPPAALADGTPNPVQHQQLRLRLGAVDGLGKAQVTSFTDITFSALNSVVPSAARSASAGSVCTPLEAS